MTPSTSTGRTAGKPRPVAQRANVLALRERPEAEVLIIGGGINGIATFRELALQGVDVAIVDRGDFVSGASSASSHMVHGGIRYLENGEFRLVREAVLERNRLIHNAPHYVRPLRTTIPIFSTFSGVLAAPTRLLVTHGTGKPRERGALLIKTGLIMYDTFSRDGGSVPRHKFHGKKVSLEEFPELNHSIKYTASYFDASMHDPERLALDVLGDGIAAGADRARSANYLEAVDSANGSVSLRDRYSGEEFEFHAKVVVNTSGPWTDLTNTALGVPSKYMGGTKGSHVVLDNRELLAATHGNEIFFEHSDGRIVLIYPLKGRVLVGTTDIDADPSKPVVCTDEEIDYFFELVRHVFPTVHVDRSQIVYTFSGIRPLPRHDDTAPGFVSRDYRIERGALGTTPCLSLVGGKWTTFRALGEHMCNEVLEILGRERVLNTATTPIGGGRDFPETDQARDAWIAANGSGHSAELTERMLHRYGTTAAEILREIPVDARPLEHVPGHYAAELAWLAANEQVVHLSDLMLRRTSVAFLGGMTRSTLKEMAEAISAPLGWDAKRTQAEQDEAIELLHESHLIEVGETGSELVTTVPRAAEPVGESANI